MIQKQMFFFNNLVIVISIIFIVIFFIPIFTVNIPLDYKINDTKLVIDAKNLNTKKDLFVKFVENYSGVLTINHDSGNFKIDKSNIYNEQITLLNMQQLNIEKDFKIYYSFKKSIISYILKKNILKLNL